jgi:Mg2+/citrate symporter
MLAGPATGPVDHPGPITQLMATITSSAATLRTHLVPALVLGILLALASVAGIGGREKRVDEQPEA